MAIDLEQRVSYLEGKIDSLATKADVERLGGELRSEIGELKGEFKAFRMMMVGGLGFVGLGLAALQIVLQVVA